jgi:hypothetical protein
MVYLAEEFGDARLRAVLTNHEDRREYICRKLGVVSDGDIHRIRAARQSRNDRGKTP